MIRYLPAAPQHPACLALLLCYRKTIVMHAPKVSVVIDC